MTNQDGLGRKQLWPILRRVPHIFLDKLKKIHENWAISERNLYVSG
jgi:hypothetical protein